MNQCISSRFKMAAILRQYWPILVNCVSAPHWFLSALSSEKNSLESELMMPDKVYKLTETIVNKIHPARVILYGSRARGDAGSRSDFDMAVEGGQITDREWCSLLADMENQSITLLPVDLLRLEEAGPALKKRILNEGIVLYDKRKTQSKPRICGSACLRTATKHRIRMTKKSRKESMEISRAI